MADREAPPPPEDGAQDVFEEALSRLARTGPEFGGGLANHGPMAAEALVELGRPDAVMPWVEKYVSRLGPYPESRNRVSRDRWRAALGDFARVGDWVALFTREIDERGWRPAIREWVPRLAPGLAAGATHGLIRTGHAARGLAARESPARRRELAEGLGYWAARFQALPGTAGSSAERLTPSRAINRVELLPASRRTRGLITESLRRLDEFPPFATVVSLVDASGDPSRFVADLTETMVRVYLANAGPGSIITLIHAVTGPSAVRLLLPYVDPAASLDLLRYAWQAAAAIYAVSAQRPGATTVGAAVGDRDSLVDRSVDSGDEHAIKFTEACLREHAVNPNPIYLQAATHAAEHLKG
jgi:hypothetical protein